MLKEVEFAPFSCSCYCLVSLDEINLMPLLVLVTIFVTRIWYSIQILMPHIFWEMMAINATPLTFPVFYHLIHWSSPFVHLYLCPYIDWRARKEKLQLPTDKNIYRIECLLFVSILTVYNLSSSALSTSILPFPWDRDCCEQGKWQCVDPLALQEHYKHAQ